MNQILLICLLGMTLLGLNTLDPKSLLLNFRIFKENNSSGLGKGNETRLSSFGNSYPNYIRFM
jgi:hypothetical protein